LIRGTYYATFDQVWELGTRDCAEADFRDMKRTNRPEFDTKDKAMVGKKGNGSADPFLVSWEAAINSENVIKNDGASSRGSHNDANVKEAIWPRHIFQAGDGTNAGARLEPDFEEASTQPDEKDKRESTTPFMIASQDGTDFMAPDNDQTKATEEKEDDQEEPKEERAEQEGETKWAIHGQIAHLLPASPLQATLYYNVIIWIFAIDARDAKAEVLQRLIHGSSKRKKDEKTPARIHLSGYKHMICNKMRLAGQGAFFDRKPCLIVVPLLSLEQIKNWSGEGYHAIAMISDGGDQQKRVNLQDAAGSLGFQDKGKMADEKEIRLAGKVLSTTIGALAYSLVKTAPSSDAASSDKNFLLTEKHLKKLTELRNTFQSKFGEGVVVPTATISDQVATSEEQVSDVKKPVRKVSFDSVKTDHPKGHPAPDPLILIVKAAVNWSRFHGQPVLAGGEVSSDDEEDDDLSLQAMQDYLEARKAYTSALHAQELPNMVIDVPRFSVV